MADRAPFYSLSLALDPDERERQRRERLVRLNTFTVPFNRVIGFNLLLLAIPLHDILILRDFDLDTFLTFVFCVEVYVVAVWLILLKFYRVDARVDLGSVFILLDVWILVGAVGLTGADQSWIFFILLLRPADQVVYGHRQTILYAHLMPLLYIALLVGVQEIEGRDIAWAGEAAKAFVLYLAGLYISQAGSYTDKLRQRTTRAMDLAGTSIRDLQHRSDELAEARETADLAREVAEEAAATAQEANAAKSQFLANMSHELRTPLNAIIGYSEMLIEDAEDEDTEDVDDLQRIRHAGKHLLGLINNILDLSKAEVGRVELDLAPVDIGQLLDGVASSALPGITAGGNQLVVQADDLGAITTDQVRLRQIVLNLLSNAGKFTHDGTVTLTARRTDDGDANGLVVAVRDTGIGMALEEVGKLFQPFVQADGSATRKYGGTGLGLAISRRLARLLGGDITVESAPGEGSTFTLTVPDLDAGRSGDGRSVPDTTATTTATTTSSS